MRLCSVKDCSKNSSFNYEGLPPKYCKQHKCYKMINVKYKKFKEIYNRPNICNNIINIDNDIRYILDLQIKKPNIIPDIINYNTSSPNYNTLSSKKFRNKQKKLINLMTNHINLLHVLIHNNSKIDIEIVDDYIKDKYNILGK